MMRIATSPPLEHFLIDVETLNDRLAAIDPRAYDKTRNQLDGATTWLGPFLAHGVIDCARVAAAVIEQHRAGTCYRLLFELGWREFFHRTWQLDGNDIFSDMRQPQHGVRSEQAPTALLRGNTGIEALDQPIERLLSDGTLHNHARLWIASIACNVAGTHWYQPARWMHHHLLDGDLASNTLSWQWVAGTFSDKRYFANQDNLNRFAGTRQHDTWLDVPYEELPALALPPALSERAEPTLDASLPGLALADSALATDQPVALRSLWNLDPDWRRDIAQQWVFVDTDWLHEWPLSAKRWRFIEHWVEQCNATLVHGSLAALQERLAGCEVHRLEYPACDDWPGSSQPRDWLYPMPEKPFRSFSAYWKQVKKSVGV